MGTSAIATTPGWLGIWLTGGAGELAVEAGYLIRGVSGWDGWLRVAWSAILGAYFFWRSASARREAQTV